MINKVNKLCFTLLCYSMLLL